MSYPQENAKIILNKKDESQVSFNSFDLKQTKSSTPLLPDRASNGSEDLFSVRFFPQSLSSGLVRIILGIVVS